MKIITQQILDIMRDNRDLINLQNLCTNYELSEEIITEFGLLDKCHLEICENQKLSIQFIENNFKKLSWTKIVTHQELSEEFILKNLGNINYLSSLISCQNISRECLEGIIKFWLGYFTDSNSANVVACKNVLTHDIQGEFRNRYCVKCNTKKFFENCEEMIMQKVLE